MDNKRQKQSSPSATKKESGQPTFGDKPWQTPQQNDQKDSQDNDSCGCGSDSEKGKKGQTTKRN